MPIAPANISDLDEMVAIWKDLCEHQLADDIPQADVQYFMESGIEGDTSSQRLDETFVYEQDGTPVGFIVLVGNMIELAVVRADYQGKSIGKQLYAHALNEVKKKHKELYAKCYTNNEKANDTLQHLGFKLTETNEAVSGSTQNIYKINIQ